MLKNIFKKIFVLIMIFSLLTVYIQPFSLTSFAIDNIKSLETPINLKWKEGSTATATWDVVENANYYIVNVYVYDENNNLIEIQETGTTNTEIDLQHEIMIIKESSGYNSIRVAFDVIAKFISDEEIIESLNSSISFIKEYNNSGSTKLEAPINLTLNNDYIGTWKKVKNAYYYSIYYKITYKGQVKTGYAIQTFQIGYNCEEKNGIVTADLTTALKNAYNNAGYTGETVQISYRIKSDDKLNGTDYEESDYSEYSNEIEYSNKGSIKLEAPTNLTLNNDYIGTWKKVKNAYYYSIYYKIIYNGQIKTGYAVETFQIGYDCEEKNGIVTADLATALKNAYN